MCVAIAIYIPLLTILYITGKSTLRVLNINNNNDLGDDGMKIISEVLQQCKSFTTLCVEACGLSVEGSYSYIFT